jgi:RecB family exonuclease
VDEAEYDLALLSKLHDANPVANVGAANYLLTANPHLGRALRARARRWLRRWTIADGLVDPDAPALAALEKHQLSVRSFSPTSLQNFAACPYRFFLNAVHQLRPEEDPSPLEVIDPLTRGSIFHAVQFELLTRLRSEALLPIRQPVLDTAITIADAVLDSVAARYEEELAPAITRVWDDGIAGIRADLREWLRREAESSEGWEPHRFELSFGLDRHDRSAADPSSVRDPVSILGMINLRGSIDLVERHPRGVLRATDHKTGKARAEADVVVGGGEVLQPVFYALACEGLFPEPVASGRLYYCTADGEYQERVVPLDDESRETARSVVEIINAALVAGYLPAAPRRQACDWCDYRPICGPYEEIRSARKPAKRLADLRRLRGLP